MVKNINPYGLIFSRNMSAGVKTVTDYGRISLDANYTESIRQITYVNSE